MLSDVNSVNKVKKIAFFVICTAFLFLGNMISLNIFDLNIKIKHKWIIIFLFSIVLYLFVIDMDFNSKISKSKLKFVFLWETFIIFIFISKAIHGNFFLLEYILYSIIVPLVFFSKKIRIYKDLFLMSSIISMVPLLYVLGSSNTLGIIICLSGISFINILLINDAKDIYICILLIMFNILIFITRSRASLISFLLVTVLVFFILVRKGTFSLSKLIKNILYILLFLLLIYFSYDYINNLIFVKRAATPQDIFSGRSKIWLGTLKTGISLFGNGEEYFLRTYYIGDAHNMFIQVLGAYGILSCVLLAVIYTYIIIKSLKLFKKPEYICFFSGFLFLNLAENLFFIGSRMIFANVLFLMYLGCFINEE